MPTTTRSATKQPKLDEIKGIETKDKKANETRKRKAPDTKPPPLKKQKKGDDEQSKPQKGKEAASAKSEVNGDATDSNEQTEGVITINRAPVLELWGACVAHSLYHEASWETCLSVGGAISTINAVAKGRSIGTMDKPDPGEAEERRQKRKEKAAKEELAEVKVMSFNLKLKDGQAMVGDKPKRGNEVALKKKFGDEQYDMAKKAFEEALSNWRGKEHDLDQQAFKMYEVSTGGYNLDLKYGWLMPSLGLPPIYTTRPEGMGQEGAAEPAECEGCYWRCMTASLPCRKN